jgi:UDP-GlcNAc:undecaprenyl-phosphate/decaprenyl-phosphate GlcNAc-1-phosphate transferase
VSAVVAFALAAALALGLWPLLRPILSAPTFERENFRHRRIPVAAGLVVVLAVLLGALLYSLVVLWSDDGPTIGRSIGSAALAAVGFGLFGLLDDLAGSAARRGYRGHLGALRHGELTTGLLKLVGGGLVAVVVAWPWAEGSLPGLIGAALVVALAANLGNLLDRAPGRVGKVSLLVIVVLAVTSHLAPELTGPALVAGAGAGMLWPDLRERCMLGDTGSNALGAGAGLGLVVTTGPGAWWIAVVVLVALNLASEAVSFSDVIARTPPLRWLDRLGAPPR